MFGATTGIFDVPQASHTLTVNGSISETSDVSFSLTKTGAGTVVLAGTNTYRGLTTVNDGTLVMQTSFTTGSGIDIADGATARLAQSITQLNNVVLRTPSINTHMTGKLDVMDNKLIVTGGDVAAITALIRSGYNGGAWNGSGGIITSTADALAGLRTLGIADADLTSFAGGTFGGVPVTGADVLVLYTVGGDTDLDGDVDLSDLGNLATHFGANSGALWTDGNFDYDNDVDLNDLGALATFFNGGKAQAYADFERLVAVPEPSAPVALLLSGGWRVVAGSARVRRK